jgi:methionine biosynthesis protein MetW
VSNPDDISVGFVSAPVSAARYDHAPESPHDVPSLLASQIRPHSFVLDVGCGMGSTIAAYRKIVVCKVLGIEPDADRAALARAQSIEVITGLYDHEINQQHGPFDVIIFADVLEHLSNPGALLDVAVKGLKKDGVILVSVPNVAHWTVRLSLVFGKFDYAPVGIMDATHLRWFTKQSAIRFFEQLGLDVSFIGSSVNARLPAYNRLPLIRSVPVLWRERLLRPWVRLWPSLFGCQHVFALRAAR